MPDKMLILSTYSFFVYIFSTVWYELLNGNWPFERQPPESIIWQVGHGLKPSFGSIKGSKEVKVMYSYY